LLDLALAGKTTGFVLIEDQWGDNLPCHPYR
jgi:hypothetical protein